jgi:carbonic anhydrase
MKKLLAGYRRFHSHVFPQKRRLYGSLAEGQRPRYMFITCADSRVDPLAFTGTSAGDMFMERSIGNLIPVAGRGEHEAGAAIEYAVVALRVEHIILCGHSNCGAMKALLDPDSVRSMPMVSAWLKGAAPTLASVRKKYGKLTGQALLDATIRENVLVQLGHLRRLPSVAPRLADGTLQLHGWVLEIEHGQVDAYNAEIDRFVALPQAYPHLR